MKKKHLVALALIILLLPAFSAGCRQQTDNPVPIAVTTELAPLCGTQDDFLEYNPDRGWRLEAFINVANTVGDGMSDSRSRRRPSPLPLTAITNTVRSFVRYTFI